MPARTTVKFVVDHMLGRLAKWLRILGYDTVYSASLDDPDLVRISQAEGRLLLTRDTGIARRKGVQCLLVTADKVEEQLLEVARRCGLRLDGEPMSRCIRCNVVLSEIDRDAVRGEVPSYVWQTQSTFRRCLVCGRLYWRGTHWDRMRERIAAIKSGLP